MASLFTVPRYGPAPPAGALLYFFQTGTNTPQNTYSDSGLTTPNTNPLVADSNGLFGPAYLLATPDYKAILKTSAGVTIWTTDPLLTAGIQPITTRGDIIVGNSVGNPVRLAIGAAATVLRSDGTDASWSKVALATDVSGILPPANAPTGSIIQTVYASYASNAGLSVAIPADDTIPQNTEGTQILTASIVPSSTSHLIRATFQGDATPSSSDIICAALFRNVGVNALCSRFLSVSLSPGFMIGLTYVDSPGSVSTQTYNLRVGSSATTVYMNGTNGPARRGGGTQIATLMLEEIVA